MGARIAEMVSLYYSYWATHTNAMRIPDCASFKLRTFNDGLIDKDATYYEVENP